MTYFPDMGCNAMIATGAHIRAVGWLHPDHPYSNGDVSPEFLSCLRRFVAKWQSSAIALGFPFAGGLHECEFCQKARAAGNFGVPCGASLFVAPEMVLHYIEEHGYRPPDEFIAALLKCPLPDSDAYQKLSEPFKHGALRP